eukprot:TRINITY_DN438_c0_g1_i1.p1 TRINITY_DN438_c0_g1~~TRINITY_DN438_c0_g1_i1.p1  ORF type:complete len:229 (-),score=38.83 TRINITY_DN438_c0_g1_i1:225-911(-)
MDKLFATHSKRRGLRRDGCDGLTVCAADLLADHANESILETTTTCTTSTTTTMTGAGSERFPWLLLIAGLSMLACLALTASFVGRSPVVRLSNPTAHTIHAAAYCGHARAPSGVAMDELLAADKAGVWDASDATDAPVTSDKPRFLSRYSRPVAVPRFAEQAVSISGNALAHVDECFLLYSVRSDLPRRVSTAEIRLWSEPAYRDGDISQRFLAHHIDPALDLIVLPF